MTERPDLSTKLDAATFRSYYYLKEELVSFCRENGLPASGGKEEITERIACYLDTGRINPVKKVSKSRKEVGVITEQTIIEPDFVCSENTVLFSKKNRKQLFFSGSLSEMAENQFRKDLCPGDRSLLSDSGGKEKGKDGY